MNWDDIKFLMAIVNHGNLKEAADFLQVAPSTVWRRIQALEATSGTAVLVADRNGYSLTDAGKRILSHAQSMDSHFGSIERILTGESQDLKGVIRLTSPPALSSINFPANLICDFQKRYPDIKFEISLSNKALNIERREADIAFRAGQHGNDNLIGRLLNVNSWYLVISDDLYNGPFLSLEDISSYPLIGYSGFSPPSVKWFNEQFKNIPQNIKCNDVATATSCALAGLGVALLPFSNLQGLTPVYRLPMQCDSKFWLITHEELRYSARIKAFWDFVLEQNQSASLFKWR